MIQVCLGLIRGNISGDSLFIKLGKGKVFPVQTVEALRVVRG
jgi:hypothetical protein